MNTNLDFLIQMIEKSLASVKFWFTLKVAEYEIGTKSIFPPITRHGTLSVGVVSKVKAQLDV